MSRLQPDGIVSHGEEGRPAAASFSHAANAKKRAISLLEIRVPINAEKHAILSLRIS
jgi:hypothetical protein